MTMQLVRNFQLDLNWNVKYKLYLIGHGAKWQGAQNEMVVDAIVPSSGRHLFHANVVKQRWIKCDAGKHGLCVGRVINIFEKINKIMSGKRGRSQHSTIGEIQLKKKVFSMGHQTYRHHLDAWLERATWCRDEWGGWREDGRCLPTADLSPLCLLWNGNLLSVQ